MDKDYLMRYLNTRGDDIAWDFIRCGYSSVSRTCITLIQASPKMLPASAVPPRCSQSRGSLLSLAGTGTQEQTHATGVCTEMMCTF